MYVKSIRLENFRNYKELSVDFDKNINILYGDNAQGKTNLLEALFVAITTKSHRTSKDLELIYFGKEEAHIQMMVDKDGIEKRIDMHLKSKRAKGIAIDQIPVRRAVDLLGIVNVIFFSPEDLKIIKNGPSERRRFIDMELCQLDKIYVNNLTNYNKCLNQRNTLLKDNKYTSFNDLNNLLDVWDLKLIEYGFNIIKKRIEFIKDLNEIIGNIHSKLSDNKEKLVISYIPEFVEDIDLNDYDKLHDIYINAIKKSRLKDIKIGNTSIGPHRDDIGFYLDTIDIRKYGSQGQQRTAALSLKLSEIELVKRITKDNPILLLDDVLSELDSKRQNHLLNNLGNIQTIISCTGLDEFINNRININKVMKVTNGTLERSNNEQQQ